MSNYLKRGDDVKLTFYSNYGGKTAYICAPDSYGTVYASPDPNDQESFTLQ